jgi:glycosyltransferase involved in cell wall biosynthesis
MEKKVLFAAANYWKSSFQVGSHQLARAFCEAGWKVAYLSDPISPFHFFKGLNLDLKNRFDNYQTTGSFEYDTRLWYYVPGALIVPGNQPVFRHEWLYRNWFRLSVPNLIKTIRNHGFGEVDLLYLGDSLCQSFWINEIKYGKSILRISDYNAGFKKYNSIVHKIEFESAQKVDAVCYTAQGLESHIKSMNPREMFYLPNGVNFTHFSLAEKFFPEEYKKIPKPIVVYVGAIDYWFDFDLINYLAAQLKDISFVLIGPDSIARQRLEDRTNIHLLGRKPYNRLPSFLSNADVGIIPFNVEKHPELVNRINPLKLYEYLACGLPVVSTEWEELIYLQSPAILCKTFDQFKNGILEVVNQEKDPTSLINFARTKDWSGIVNDITKKLNL